MPNELNIEQQIREAMERGEFDNLPGKGKPLDLDAYFATPEDMRMGFAMLKSNNFVPEGVEIQKEIAALKEKLKTCLDEGEKLTLTKAVNEKALSLIILLENRNRKR